MVVKRIIDEVFQDYKAISMFICAKSCDGKCWKDLNLDSTICQNDDILNEPSIDIPNEKIIERYLKNDLTESIIIGGLEPFLQEKELFDFIDEFRKISNDTIVIYTGYNENELEYQIKILSKYKNIIVKFGRYVPSNSPIFDEVLGVELISNNQYARKLS